MAVELYRRLYVKGSEDYVVEKIDDKGDGTIDMAVFTGPRAQPNAEHFAYAVYGGFDRVGDKVAAGGRVI